MWGCGLAKVVLRDQYYREERGHRFGVVFDLWGKDERIVNRYGWKRVPAV